MLDKHGDSISGAIFTHTLGFPFNEPLIREMLGNERFYVVDACDAIGATIGKLPVGTWADIVTYSFFPAHQICAIEGGAIVTDDDRLFTAARQYTNWGRDCHCLPGQSGVCGKRFGYMWDKLPEGWDHKYTFTKLGYNLKMTEFQGALGYSQILRLKSIVDSRLWNYLGLLSELKEFSEYFQFIERLPNSIPCPFGFPLILKDKYKTLINPLIEWLESAGIATRRMFGGNLLRQPAFQDLQYIAVPDLDGANIMLEQALWVGVHPNIGQDEIDYMVQKCTEFFNERGLF